MKSELQKTLETGISSLQKRIARESDTDMKDYMNEYRKHLEEMLLKEKRYFSELNNKPKQIKL